MVRLLMVLLVMFLPGVALAEQAEAVQKLQGEFSGQFEFGGFKTTGNTKSDSFDTALELNYKLREWSIGYTFKGNQTTESDVLTAEYYESYLKGKVELPADTYYFVQIGYRQDVFSGIYSENTALTGFGYHFFSGEERYSLDAELGYGSRDTKKTTKTKIDHDPGTHGALFAKYLFSEKDTVKLDITLESGNDDDFIKKEFVWEHEVIEALKVILSYDERTLTQPEPGTEATDTNLSVKLGYEF